MHRQNLKSDQQCGISVLNICDGNAHKANQLHRWTAPCGLLHVDHGPLMAHHTESYNYPTKTHITAYINIITILDATVDSVKVMVLVIKCIPIRRTQQET